MALRAIYLPRPDRGRTAYDWSYTCWAPMIRVQMTISRARDEGRLTMLQRAETGAIPPGQTTLITSTVQRKLAR